MDRAKNVFQSQQKLKHQQRLNISWIKIKDIACGWYHNLAIDYNGNVYSWGHNGAGQCGRDNNDSFLIDSLKEHTIIKIKCGVQHSYAMSDNNEHFLFGHNKYNQCTLTDDFLFKVKL